MNWRSTLPASCWDAREAATIIPVEAESTSDAVFLATHSSIPITLRDQVAMTGEGGPIGTVVDEHALLRAVQEQPADQPIIPILGKSGTGKSHLVRWLRINLSTKESTRLIFVPKHRMSLRSILELILEHATGDRAKELRAKVATAVDAFVDETEAMLRLRATLSVLIETRGEKKDRTPEEVELRAYLAGPTGLPALLGDPVFRGRLLHRDGPIARLVREKLSGKGAEDKEDAFGFSASDLDLSVDDVKKAGDDACSVAGALTSDLGLRTLAATMLNEQLGSAVSEVFGIGGDDLKNLLDELRLELHRQGLELLLLIEDFSIFQGIQGGLVDAITMIPTEDHQICPMRVVMAVTTGYFTNQMPDTVFTRTYKAFELDVVDAQKTSFDPAGFATPYLNAVRVGSEGLSKAQRAGSTIPNACEQCPVNDSCHAAFGAVDGHGLFPFNRTALDRAIQSQTVEGKFVARDVLTRVLRPVLYRDQTEIDEGRFPSSAFADDFAAGARGILSNVEDKIQLTSGDPEETERRVRLVRFWGDGSGPQNLSPIVHEAFAVPSIPSLGTVVKPRPRREGGAGAGSGAGVGPVADRLTNPDSSQPQLPPLPGLVRAVDHWHETGELIQGDRTRLRRIVHGAVTAYLDLDDGFSGASWWTSGDKHLAPSFDATNGVALDDNKLADALLPISRKDNSNVRVLRALAWLDTVEDWTDIPKGDELQRLCDQKVRSWATIVGQNLIPARDRRDDPELAQLAHALLTISKALGIPEAFKADPYNRVKALFAQAPVPQDAQARPVLRRWQEVISTEGGQRIGRENLQQRLLRLASYSQGFGKPLGLDVGRLSRALRDKAADGQWPAETPSLVREACDTILSHSQALDEVRIEALALLPDTSEIPDDISDAIAALSSLFRELSTAGLLPLSIDQGSIIAAGKAVKATDQRTLEKVRTDLLRWDVLSSDERLQVLTSDWDGAAANVRAWLVPAEQALAILERRFETGPVSEAQQDYEKTRADLLAAVAGLAERFASIDEPEEVV
ncbi:protein DpdH [Kribbella sp. NPDC051718]|uniref:protein DpdH n=1 Tax=Kribbella sp. NPDC051718 TaxID=3155168 RepID=UPI00342E67E0